MTQINDVHYRIQRHTRAGLMVVHLSRLAPYLEATRSDAALRREQCGAINNANTLVAISVVTRAQLVQQCKCNIVRVLQATMYMLVNVSRVTCCWLCAQNSVDRWS
jgi:hypothetical protein